MKLRISTLVSVFLVVWLAGCAPPTTGTKGTYSISVTQPTAGQWAYTITTTGTSNITKVVFTLNVSGCSVKSKPPTWRDGAVPGGIQVEDAAGAKTVNITLECDATDGPIYVDVHPLGGAANTIGPISGPT